MLALVGTLAAAVLCVAVNVLASRFGVRWDATSDRLYTLSDVTRETLAGLDRPVEVIVFLSRNDPLMHSTRTLLEGYRAESSQLRVRYVDPDQNPAEFVALQQRYGLFEGRTENGRLATDASIVLASGDHRWFVTTDDLIVFDDEDGLARPRLEQSITEGLVNLVGRTPVTVCVTQGHREPALDDGSAQGLAEFRRELERNNLTVRAVDLASPSPTETLAGCRLVVVAGPGIPFEPAEAERLRRQLATGTSLFVLVGPVTDDQGRILDPGLGATLRDVGVEFQGNLVFEGDERLRLPVGIGGEVFLASPLPHPTTEPFFRHGEVSERILLQLAQGLTLSESSSARSLLQSSEHAFEIRSFRALQGGELTTELDVAQHVLAAAWEAPPAAEPNQPARVVLLGTPSVLWPSTFTDPALLSTRRFVENSVNWLVAAPSLVAVPEKQGQIAGLDLSEGTLAEVQRYVLLYLPLAVLALGTLVVWRRRKELPE